MVAIDARLVPAPVATRLRLVPILGYSIKDRFEPQDDIRCPRLNCNFRRKDQSLSMENSRRETLVGAWILKGSSVVADDTEIEIERRLREDLRQVAVSREDWAGLFFDPLDESYWELTFPQGHMHGGGPKRLSPVASERAQNKKWRLL